MQLKRRALHIHVRDSDKRGGIPGGDLDPAQLIRQGAVIHADIVQLEVLRNRQVIAFNNPVADQHPGAVHHIHVINEEVIAAVNRDRRVIDARGFTEVRRDVFRFYIADDEMFAVLHMHQLATVAAGDVRHHEVLHRLAFRVGIIVGAARKADADAPVDFAVGAVDLVKDVVGDKKLRIVDRDVPFDGVALEPFKASMSDTHVAQFVMKSLAQNAVVGVVDVDIVNHQALHLLRLFAADVNLHHRAEAAHLDAFNRHLRAAHVENDVMQAPFFLAQDLAAVLENKTSFAVAFERAEHPQGFPGRHKHRAVDIVTGETGGHFYGLRLTEGKLKRLGPVVLVEISDIHGFAARHGMGGAAVQQRHQRRSGAGLHESPAGKTPGRHDFTHKTSGYRVCSRPASSR